MKNHLAFLHKNKPLKKRADVHHLFLALIFTLAFTLNACTHIQRPSEIINRSEAYLDWSKNPPKAIDRAGHDLLGKRPFEWWYFDGHLDSGQTFVGVFLAPSFTNGKPGAAFSLYESDWSKEFHGLVFEPDDISVSKKDLSVETPAGFARHIDHKTFHVRWEIDDIIADFKLSTESPGWMPSGKDGVNESNLDFFWAVHQGRNRIRGTITRNGVITKVTGVGYADHNWGRKPLNEITRKWVWGRILAGDYTIIYADVDYIDPSIRSRPLYIAKGNKIIVGTGSPNIRQSDFATHPVLKRHYPRLIEIDFENNGVKADIRIQQKYLVEEVDLLTTFDLNIITRWFVQTFIARPTYFRAIADFDAEIAVNGSKDKIFGTCLYEVMGFE